MNQKTALYPLLLITLMACGQENQPLPFDADSDEPREEAVTAQGATLTSSAGASVMIPAGAVSETMLISITPVQTPQASTGSPASKAFRLEPTGLTLAKKARLSIKMEEAALNHSDAWLATLLNHTSQGVEALTNTSVDLSNGLVRSDLLRLGTVTAVIPNSESIVRASQLQPTLVSHPLYTHTGLSSRIWVQCGILSNQKCNNIQVEVSSNLLDHISEAALVYPQASGAFDISAGKASGIILFQGDLRAKVNNSVATSVGVNIRIEPTASTLVIEDATTLRITNVKFTFVSNNDIQSRVEDVLLQVNENSATATLDRIVDFTNKNGTRDTGRIRIKLTLHRDTY